MKLSLSAAQQFPHDPENCPLCPEPAPTIAPPFRGPVFLTLVDYGPGIGHAINEAVPERCDWARIVDCIAGGEWEKVVQVIRLDAGGTWHDVTELAFKAAQLIRES